MIDRPLVPAFDGDSVTVGSLLDAQVDLLCDAHRGGDRVAAEVLRAWGAVSGSADEVLAVDLDVETARLAIARDHRYADWPAAREHAAERVDLRFEAAADAIQWGELDALRARLDGMPELVRMRSPFPHRAALLHHVAANGIEVERQLQSPPNAVEIARLLLECGAEPDAICTSWPCAERGPRRCRAAVQALGRRCGPAPGRSRRRRALRTAITFGYTEAGGARPVRRARDNSCSPPRSAISARRSATSMREAARIGRWSWPSWRRRSTVAAKWWRSCWSTGRTSGSPSPPSAPPRWAPLATTATTTSCSCSRT